MPATTAIGRELTGLRAAREVVVTATRRFAHGDASILGGAIAFFTTLSLAPLLVLAIAITGMVFDAEAAQERVVAMLTAAVDPSLGEPLAELLRDLLRAAALDDSGGLKVALGVTVTLWGASRIFVYLQKALNRVWGVAPHEGHGLRERALLLVRKRALSFLVVLLCGVVLFASLLVDSFGSALQHAVGEAELATSLLAIALKLASSLVIFGFLCVTYRYLPDVELDWADVWVGALATTMFVAVGGKLLSLYLVHVAGSSPAGAAGSAFVMLLGLYVHAEVFLYGAELTRAVTELRRGPPAPEPHAAIEPRSRIRSAAPGLKARA